MHRLKLFLYILVVVSIAGECRLSPRDKWYIYVNMVNRGKETIHMRGLGGYAWERSQRVRVGYRAEIGFFAGEIDGDFEPLQMRLRPRRMDRELGILSIWLLEKPEEGDGPITITMTEPEFWELRFSSDNPKVRVTYSP